MNKRLWFLAVIMGLSLALGCATTSDPRTGGLIGYWKHKHDYEERIKQREQNLGELESEGEVEQETARNLTQDRNQLLEERQRQREALIRLNSDLDNISSEIDSLELQTDSKIRERETIIEKIKHLKAAIEHLRKDTQLTVTERETRIAELKQEIDLLSEAAIALTL